MATIKPVSSHGPPPSTARVAPAPVRQSAPPARPPPARPPVQRAPPPTQTDVSTAIGTRVDAKA